MTPAFSSPPNGEESKWPPNPIPLGIFEFTIHIGFWIFTHWVTEMPLSPEAKKKKLGAVGAQVGCSPLFTVWVGGPWFGLVWFGRHPARGPTVSRCLEA